MSIVWLPLLLLAVLPWVNNWVSAFVPEEIKGHIRFPHFVRASELLLLDYLFLENLKCWARNTNTVNRGWLAGLLSMVGPSGRRLVEFRQQFDIFQQNSQKIWLTQTLNTLAEGARTRYHWSQWLQAIHVMFLFFSPFLRTSLLHMPLLCRWQHTSNCCGSMSRIIQIWLQR